MPLVCHVPFKLDASREFVDPQENKIWFNEACGYFSQLLDYAYQDWSKIVKADIISYLPGMTRSLFADNNGKELCLSRQAAFKGNHFSALPIFYTTNGHFAAIDRIFSFDSAEEVFAPQHAYELLNVTRELFLPPDGKSTQGVGIYTERRIYYRLFDIALKNPAKTEDILSYLSSAGFKPADENIPKESAILNAYQISLLMQCKSFANAFMEHSKVCVNAGKRPTYLIQSPNFVSINAALYGDFKLSEAPKAVEQYLGWCSGNCVLMDINEEQYLPCNNALLLSKKNPLSSFVAFCYAIDSRDTFSIRMKHREISERLNQLSESNEGSADDYLRELRNNRLLGRDAIGKQQYQNYIDLILKSGTNHTRFVQEPPAKRR